MRFTIEPTFRFHLRCALLIAMSAAFATLFGAMLWSAERVTELESSQRGFESDASRLQRQLDRKVTEMRAEADDQRMAVEAKLKALADQEDAAAAKAKVDSTKAPFAIQSVLGSIVELVCIDNKDRETYYTGSGTVIDPSGLIITNQHLLVSTDNSLIRYCGVGFTDDLHVPPKITYVGSAVAVHDGTDLALLKITERLDGGALPKAFPAIALTDAKDSASALELGDPIYIGGYPGIGAETFTFTQGVVSGRVGTDLIKTSALIDSGTSGGAAFDAGGRYVGVPTAAAKGEIGGSLGYLIGANVIDQFLSDYAGGKNAVPPAKTH